MTEAESLNFTGDSIVTLAFVGQVAVVLVFTLGVIWLLSRLLRRLQGQQNDRQQHLQVLASKPVGTRERVVLVQVADRWLVLGVGSGRVNQLAELPAAEEPPQPPGQPAERSQFRSVLSQFWPGSGGKSS